MSVELLLAAAIVFAVPVALAALGGMWSLAVGDLNISLEGQMLLGSFIAIATTYFTGSSLLGVLGALVGGLGSGALFGLLVVRLRGNPFIVGIAVNLLLSALSVFLLGSIFGVRGSFSDPSISRLPRLSDLGLGGMPWFGAIADRVSVLALALVLLTALSWYLLRRTTVGTRLTAAREAPSALATAGVSVAAARTWAQIVAGALCGMAGAELSLGSLTLFAADMTAGRGFIAIALVLLVGTRPILLALTTIGYGLIDGIGIQLQQVGMPPQITEALPYVSALIALVIVAARATRRHRALTGERAMVP